MTDMRDDELVWMHHTDPDHDGYFQCPAAAVPAFEARGWERSDPPEEHNPVTAEHNAWLAELAATRELEAAEEAKAAATAKSAKKATASAKSATKSTTSAARGDEPKE